MALLSFNACGQSGKEYADSIILDALSEPFACEANQFAENFEQSVLGALPNAAPWSYNAPFYANELAVNVVNEACAEGDNCLKFDFFGDENGSFQSKNSTCCGEPAWISRLALSTGCIKAGSDVYRQFYFKAVDLTDWFKISYNLDPDFYLLLSNSKGVIINAPGQEEMQIVPPEMLEENIWFKIITVVHNSDEATADAFIYKSGSFDPVGKVEGYALGTKERVDHEKSSIVFDLDAYDGTERVGHYFYLDDISVGANNNED